MRRPALVALPSSLDEAAAAVRVASARKRAAEARYAAAQEEMSSANAERWDADEGLDRACGVLVAVLERDAAIARIDTDERDMENA